MLHIYHAEYAVHVRKYVEKEHAILHLIAFLLTSHTLLEAITTKTTTAFVTRHNRIVPRRAAAHLPRAPEGALKLAAVLGVDAEDLQPLGLVGESALPVGRVQVQDVGTGSHDVAAHNQVGLLAKVNWKKDERLGSCDVYLRKCLN